MLKEYNFIVNNKLDREILINQLDAIFKDDSLIFTNGYKDENNIKILNSEVKILLEKIRILNLNYDESLEIYNGKKKNIKIEYDKKLDDEYKNKMTDYLKI